MDNGASASQTGLSSADADQAPSGLAHSASIPCAVVIPNETRWYFHINRENEWWHRGGKTREEAIDAGIAEYGGEPFWITEARSMVPSFALFDADDICERLNEDECWWEDGWTGQPGMEKLRELERRLEDTFKTWFAEFATLDGACLDAFNEEQITASAIEARRAETAKTGSVEDESAVAKPDAQTQDLPK